MWIVTILGGLLAASSYIIGKEPKAKEYIDKISEYQGYLWILLLIYGIRYAIRFIGNAWPWLEFFPLRFWVYLVVAIINILLWVLLWYNLFAKYLSKDVEEKAQAMKEKLVSYQEKIGIAAIILWLVSIII